MRDRNPLRPIRPRDTEAIGRIAYRHAPHARTLDRPSRPSDYTASPLCPTSYLVAMPQPDPPHPRPAGGPHPPSPYSLSRIFRPFSKGVLAGGLASSTLEGQGMFRRWRLTPLHRQRGCRSSLLSSVCCHIGDFNFASDLSVCPNALPLAALHRTNTRTLTMFTRFIC